MTTLLPTLVLARTCWIRRRFDEQGSDVGGPGSALGSGVEAALTGADAESGDEGGASSQPQPSGN